MTLPEHKAHVRNLAEKFGELHRAREPLALAEILGLKLQYGDLGDKDGAFDPSRNVVLLNKSASPERQRFTMAHEVIHALILQDGDFLSDLHDAYESDEFEESLEVLCNVGASALLLPKKELDALLEKSNFAASSIPRMAQQFGISRSAACVAFVQYLQQPCIAAVVRAQTIKKQNKNQKAQKFLEVEFSARSESMKYPLATGTIIPADHVICVAFETGFEVAEDSTIPFRSGQRMPAFVDAYPENGLVYVLFTVPKNDKFRVKTGRPPKR